MTKGPSIKFNLMVAIGFLILSFQISWRFELQFPIQKFSIARVLYLPSGKYLKLTSLGFPEFEADLLYLWSIQFIGDPSIVNRYEYLEKIYNDITDLNPKFTDAYQLGALIAYYEMRDLNKALKLLDKGILYNPHQWQLAVSAGYYASISKKHDISKEYFLKASKMRNAPSWTVRWVAAENYRLGDKKEALKFWQEALKVATDEMEKQLCKAHIHDLIIEISIDNIYKAIDAFNSFYSRRPLNLNELVETGFLDKMPLDPNGKPYLYDPRTGKVHSQTPFKTYHQLQ